MVVPVYTDLDGRSLVHAKNDTGTSIFGKGRAACPLVAALRAVRCELAFWSRIARREASIPTEAQRGRDGGGQVGGLGGGSGGSSGTPEAAGAAVSAGVGGVDPFDGEAAGGVAEGCGELGQVVAEGGLGAGRLPRDWRDGGCGVHDRTVGGGE